MGLTYSLDYAQYQSTQKHVLKFPPTGTQQYCCHITRTGWCKANLIEHFITQYVTSQTEFHNTVGYYILRSI